MVKTTEEHIADMRANNAPQDKIDDELDWLRSLNEDVRRLENDE